MASGPNMMDPICLIENKNAQFSVNQKALQILENISQPVVVVAIVGLCRTSKSYLMNMVLAGQNHGECYGMKEFFFVFNRNWPFLEYQRSEGLEGWRGDRGFEESSTWS